MYIKTKNGPGFKSHQGPSIFPLIDTLKVENKIGYFKKWQKTPCHIFKICPTVVKNNLGLEYIQNKSENLKKFVTMPLGNQKITRYWFFKKNFKPMDQRSTYFFAGVAMNEQVIMEYICHYYHWSQFSEEQNSTNPGVTNECDMATNFKFWGLINAFIPFISNWIFLNWRQHEQVVIITPICFGFRSGIFK